MSNLSLLFDSKFCIFISYLCTFVKSAIMFSLIFYLFLEEMKLYFYFLALHLLTRLSHEFHLICHSLVGSFGGFRNNEVPRNELPPNACITSPTCTGLVSTVRVADDIWDDARWKN